MPGWRRFLEYEVMENAAFGALCRAGRAVPATIKPLNRLAAATLSKRSYSAPSHEVFVTSRRVRFVESEYAVPRESLLDVLAELRAGVARLADPSCSPSRSASRPPTTSGCPRLTGATPPTWRSTSTSGCLTGLLQALRVHRCVGGRAAALGQDAHSGRCLPSLAPTRGSPTSLRIRDSTDPSRLFANPYLQQVFGD